MLQKVEFKSNSIAGKNENASTDVFWDKLK